MDPLKKIKSFNLRLQEKKHYEFKCWCIQHKISITKQLNKMIDDILSHK